MNLIKRILLESGINFEDQKQETPVGKELSDKNYNYVRGRKDLEKHPLFNVYFNKDKKGYYNPSDKQYYSSQEVLEYLNFKQQTANLTNTI